MIREPYSRSFFHDTAAACFHPEAKGAKRVYIYCIFWILLVPRYWFSEVNLDSCNQFVVRFPKHLGLSQESMSGVGASNNMAKSG